ncbi:MAG: hypothetical protein JO097_18780 [Acidobacteriaceae bacterium]|nr:hypothetical protein [Acidobacteriaceae bacterium]MBV9296490.1 hypothetical protein [Acidobacteriaceae bacterium]MBV9765809.1 hypothetical protein [Acidobacteriaceae bacterium]
MSKSVFILALAVFGATAVAARATPSDPRIIVSGGGDPTAVETPVFTFMSDAAGGGVLSFVNDTSLDWTSLDFFVKLPSGSPITCSSPVYNTCDFTSTPIVGTTISQYDIGFENPASAGGLLPGDTLTINLDDTGSAVNGSGSWGPNNTFTAVVNLPEPSSFFFLAAGLLLLGGLRRYSRRTYF